MHCKITYKNGEIKEIKPECLQNANVRTVRIAKEDIPADCDHIDFLYDYFRSGVCDGYMIAPRGTQEGGTILCRFRKRADCEYISDSNYMPIYGFKTEEKTVFAVVTGMTYEYKIVLGVKDGTYYIYPRFFVDEQTNYEDICVELHTLAPGSDYNDMAALYKKMKNPKPLIEKVQGRPCLKYALEAPEIRIRMAWKPVPTPVKCQTEENEPPVVVGCTLERATDILNGLKARGVDKCEICLVGIETKGHDGRWPQFLPIEDSIGGETALREFCAYGQKLGFQMVVHTNSTEMYQISSDWDKDALCMQKDGEYSKDEILWGGGQPFHLCPAQSAKYTERNLKATYEMGFRGLHYIDVITNFSPRACYSKSHPLTARESAKVWCDIGKKTQEIFGGFASEGGFDFASDVLDYALYISYNLFTTARELVDETIPFWQLVYHVSILYNPSTETGTYCVKSEKHHLKFIEYGGRPLGYFNSKYVDEGGCGNWMGEEDLLCATDALLNDALDRFAKVYEEYKTLSYLQYEQMLRHDKIAEGVYRVSYSDGTCITVDYNNMSYEVKKVEE